MGSHNCDIGKVTISGGEGSLPSGVGIAGESVALKPGPSNAGEVFLKTSTTVNNEEWPLEGGISLDYIDAREILFEGTNGDVVHYLITRP